MGVGGGGVEEESGVRVEWGWVEWGWSGGGGWSEGGVRVE